MYACPFTHDNVNNTISRMPLIAGESGCHPRSAWGNCYTIIPVLLPDGVLITGSSIPPWFVSRTLVICPGIKAIIMKSTL